MITPDIATLPRLKRVDTSRLIPGMFIHSLGVDWWRHLFVRNKFKLTEHDIARIRADGIKEVVIDIARGLDIPYRENPFDTRQRFAALDRRMEQARHARDTRRRHQRSFAEERGNAIRFRKLASHAVRRALAELRTGRCRTLDSLSRIARQMIDSVVCQRDALLPLLRLRSGSTQDIDRSLSCATLTVSIGLTLELPGADLEQIALGVMLRDVGADNAENRTAGHIRRSIDMLSRLPGITDKVLRTIAEHHERYDGTGLFGLTGSDNDLSIGGQLAAIADHYDLLVSPFPPEPGLEPPQALRHVRNSAEHAAEIAGALVLALGTYPAGSLVRLDNGKLGIVETVNREDPERPVVRIFYNADRREHIIPYRLDLARRLDPPAIVGAENWFDWKLEPAAWLPQ